MFELIEVYKGQEITRLGNVYTVLFEGDEVAFHSVQEARNFIEEVQNDF